MKGKKTTAKTGKTKAVKKVKRAKKSKTAVGATVIRESSAPPAVIVSLSA